MMKKIRAAIIGYGNIGRYILESLIASPDFEVAGVVRRDISNIPTELEKYDVVTNVSQLKNVDVALLSVPTRSVELFAKECLELGINTVDSFDIHNQIVNLRKSLNKIAKEHNSVSVISAGWDPGSDSVIRTLFEAMAPSGITYTNFGPGMSMGHTVAVKSIEGVRNALSMTIPTGTGVHRRMVYVELEEGYSFDEVANLIKSDNYFKNDDTRVFKVDDVNMIKDVGHGVMMERKGVSGNTHNQTFKFDMRINNPALTAQMMVSAARATTRLNSGAYTMVEISVIDLLPGERESWINKLV